MILLTNLLLSLAFIALVLFIINGISKQGE